MGRSMVQKNKFLLAFLLSALVATTIITGIIYRHYFVVSLFAVWVVVELAFWRFASSYRPNRQPQKPRFPVDALVKLFLSDDASSKTLLKERLSRLAVDNTLTTYERRWIERLLGLADLQQLTFETVKAGKRRFAQGFTYVKDESSRTKATDTQPLTFSAQDITDSAMTVADLYWKLYDTAMGSYPELTKPAHLLFKRIFAESFDADTARTQIERLSDSIQRDGGFPFIILNLIRKGHWQMARQITELLLRQNEALDIDEEIRSSLYWVTELYWFTKERTSTVSDYETSIRYLYHLCFTNPERAGFLEIDSQFFSQFETVSELVKEALLFKETLVERIFILWKEHEGYFDNVFLHNLEVLTNQKCKIYDHREAWESFWKREKQAFLRDYLYVVEGNLCYANSQYEDAQAYYEKALRLNAGLRPACLNLIFCYARTGNQELHQFMVDKLLADRSLWPAALYVVANSFFLLRDSKTADHYYEELKKVDGWQTKTEYYKSTFCFENGLFELALDYAQRANHANPNDSSIRYHLSLCYNAVGEKDRALDMVKT
ncbi:MAG: hypothetical protein HY537_14025, partial [Deltaproteobacteria bacterium]|nr:hypothetical protein [Deltaproteobacteria bacterium]